MNKTTLKKFLCHYSTIKINKCTIFRTVYSLTAFNRSKNKPITHSLTLNRLRLFSPGLPSPRRLTICNEVCTVSAIPSRRADDVHQPKPGYCLSTDEPTGRPAGTGRLHWTRPDLPTVSKHLLLLYMSENGSYITHWFACSVHLFSQFLATVNRSFD